MILRWTKIRPVCYRNIANRLNRTVIFFRPNWTIPRISPNKNTVKYWGGLNRSLLYSHEACKPTALIHRPFAPRSSFGSFSTLRRCTAHLTAFPRGTPRANGPAGSLVHRGIWRGKPILRDKTRFTISLSRITHNAPLGPGSLPPYPPPPTGNPTAGNPPASDARPSSVEDRA